MPESEKDEFEIQADGSDTEEEACLLINARRLKSVMEVLESRTGKGPSRVLGQRIAYLGTVYHETSRGNVRWDVSYSPFFSA